MASTSTQRVVLPSIHEMFPEHLMPLRGPHPPYPAHAGVPRLHLDSSSSRPPQPPQLSFSFDVLKTDPRGTSLQHIASSRPRTQRRLSPMRGSSSSNDGDADADMDDVEDEEGTAEDVELEEGKKHVCHTCGKRFNRPSSLRIHVNTHTGATPFRCPYPNCNRAFNVNSNMRRHYRNHATPSSSYSYAPSHSASLAPTLHAFPVSPHSPISPIPTSPSWSTSSASSSNSPITPQTPHSDSNAFLRLRSPSSPHIRSPVSPYPYSSYSHPYPWVGSARPAVKGYSESDVRSE